jgi:ribonuclease P protein component
MLAKPNRLTRRRDFDALFKKGRGVSDASLSLRYTKTGLDKPFRLAFIISTKTEKSAVRRNRAKRQAREIVRPMIAKLPKGVDGALSIRRPFLSMSPVQQKQAITRLFSRAKLI